MKLIDTLFDQTIRKVKDMKMDPFTITDSDFVICAEKAEVPAHYRAVMVQLKRERYGSQQNIQLPLGGD